VRRDPMAMLPFCGYSMGDYFQHWLEIGPRLSNPPLIFHVNWFRKSAEGKFLWPGFGNNMRVLEWIIERIEGRGAAKETALGNVPESLDMKGMESFGAEKFAAATAVTKDEWRKEMPLHAEMVEGKLAEKAPKELLQRFEELKAAFL
jgi:phosphoenolpyruvate carboxykinase (GTP)